MNNLSSWQKDLIEEGKKVIKHGYGRVIFRVTKKEQIIETVFTRINRKKIKAGGTDPE